MTRTEQIQAAKAFTEKHKDSHRVFLEEGYIEASMIAMIGKFPYKRPERKNATANRYFKKVRIWAIDANGIATTDY